MTTATFDVDAFRGRFSALASGTAHFDGPGGTQTPDAVARAMYEALTHPLSNRGRATPAERNADDIVRACRAAVGDLLGVEPGTVVLGRSMTALTFEMSRTVARRWRPGDEVVVSRLEHDANVSPWLIAAEHAGATVRWADFDPATGELEAEAVGAQLSDRTVLVALTAASNLLGTIPDVAAVAELVHAAGALLYVDGVHHTAHRFVDVAALGADLFACSPYKFFGPHCGIVTGRADLLDELHPDKLRPSSDAVPERFELGTLPYELMAGTAAAVDFIAGLGGAGGPDGSAGSRRARLREAFRLTEDHEATLLAALEAGLAELPQVTVRSRAKIRTPTLLLTFEGHEAADVSRFLAARDVNAPSGSFYALEPSRHLGLGDRGGLRIGLAPYNTADDIGRLLAALRAYLAGDR